MSNFKYYIKDIIKLNKIGMIIILILSSCETVLSIIQPKIMQMIVDNGIQERNLKLLINISIFYIILMLVQYGIQYIVDLYHVKVKKSYTYDLKLKLLSHISKLSGKYFTEKKSGELIKVVESDIYAIEDAGVDLIIQILFNFITSICAIVLLAQINYLLLIVILVIEAGMVFFQKYMINKMYEKVQELREISGESMSLTEEYISNIVNFIIAKAEKVFMKNFAHVEGENVKKTMQYKSCTETGKQVNNLMNGMMSVIIYLISGIFIINGKMTIGTMIAFAQYTYYVVNPFLQIINSYTQIQNMMVSINKVYEVFDIPIEDQTGKEKIAKDDIDIKIQHVDFAYRKDEKVLNDINMEFNPKSITAIVGESGSGKSTITKILYGLWDATEGDINIGGIPIKKIDINDLRSKIAIVTQDSVLFNDTLMNNIVLDKIIPDDELEMTCKIVKLDDLISELPNGLKENIGERGNKLSGGQQQRVTLARAILENTPIIILDEATSALDNVTQRFVMDQIEDILKEKTTIVITHRISTIQNADYIYVLKDHKIIEEGSPKELVGYGEEYKRLQLYDNK